MKLFLGDLSDVGTPGPIPNPEVKHVSADGTWRATSWESRSLPRNFSFFIARAGSLPRAFAFFCMFFIFKRKVGDFFGFSTFTKWRVAGFLAQAFPEKGSEERNSKHCA